MSSDDSVVAPSPEHTLLSRRALRLAALTLSAAGAAVAAATAGTALVAAGKLTAPPPLPKRDPVLLLRPLLPRTVRLSGPAAHAQGRWGVAYPGGYIQFDRVVLSHADGSVSRRVVHRFGSEPHTTEAGVAATVDRVAFPADAELAATVFPGLQVWQVDAPDGTTLPLWHLPAPAAAIPTSGLAGHSLVGDVLAGHGLAGHSLVGDCLAGDGLRTSGVAVVGAHGRGAAPAELLRLAGPCRQVGAPLWAASYRHDPVVRGERSTLMTLGWGEADDLWLQLGEVVARSGVSQVVLAGVSLGGAAVANLLIRRGVTGVDGKLLLPLPAVRDGSLVVDEGRAPVTVAGVLLEAPALHWPDIVAEVAAGLRLPRRLATPTLALARLRVRLDPVALSPLVTWERSVTPGTPLLAIHGTTDPVVPVAVSDRLVSAWPGAGYLRLSGGGHARAFNETFPRYRQAVTRFLQTVALTS
jgi:fermentation-respiration switch protein FrsA (DUF1100 family)